VKVILSRTKPQLVQRLFEQEIPEIAESVIEIRSISREPGYRTKVAVSSTDQRVDCVGACVGVRGNRIKNIVDELAGERIDIVRFSDDMQVLIPNALQPAEVEEVILCQMLGRAIVLVQEDQLSLAIGRRGQNVRLASKLCGWDIEIMTREELDEQIEQAVAGYSSIEGVEPELAERLVGEGFLSYDDLSVIEPDALMEMSGLSAEQVDRIVQQAETKATEAERAAAQQRRQQREQDRIEAADAAEAAATATPYTADGKPAEVIEQATSAANAAEAAASKRPAADASAEAAAPHGETSDTADGKPAEVIEQATSAANAAEAAATEQPAADASGEAAAPQGETSDDAAP
jgi:N utilization substance protein A